MKLLGLGHRVCTQSGFKCRPSESSLILLCPKQGQPCVVNQGPDVWNMSGDHRCLCAFRLYSIQDLCSKMLLTNLVIWCSWCRYTVLTKRRVISIYGTAIVVGAHYSFRKHQEFRSGPWIVFFFLPSWRTGPPVFWSVHIPAHTWFPFLQACERLECSFF